MTEIAGHWDQGQHNSDQELERKEPADDAPLVALTQALQEENERLVQLAEACRDYGTELAERQKDIVEREQRLVNREEALSQRIGEIEQREQRVNELAAHADETRRRLAEAAEREAELAALGAELTRRYRAQE